MAIKSDLSSIANKAGYIPSADWTNYLRGLTPEGREELRASLFGESPTQVSLPESPELSLTREIYNAGNRFNMGYQTALGDTGLDSDWIPGMNYASPYAPQEEYDLVRKAYQLYMQNNGPEWSDSPLGIIHAPMTWAFSNAGELLNDMPNVAKALFSPSTAAYGAVKELRGPIDALENIVLPIVSMAYTGSTAGGKLSASAHNLMRRKSTGEDIDWSGYAQETGEGALTGGVLSAAGGVLAGGLTSGLQSDYGLSAEASKDIGNMASRLIRAGSAVGNGMATGTSSSPTFSRSPSSLGTQGGGDASSPLADPSEMSGSASTAYANPYANLAAMLINEARLTPRQRRYEQASRGLFPSRYSGLIGN